MRELLQQALAALEHYREQTRPIERCDEAIDALKQALAAPQPEPVAWKCAKCGNTSDCEGVMVGDNWCNSCAVCGEMRPLYAAPPAAPIDGFGGNLDSAFDAPVSGSTDGLSQDYNGKLGKWFADRLGAREQLRRDMPPAAPAPAVPDWMHELDEILSNATITRTDAEMVDAAWLAVKKGWAQLATPAVREPLTQDQIVGLAQNYEERYHRWVFICVDELEQFARAIEAHHGIGGGNG